ncbi:alpha/beta hydrolase [Microbispora oryzae]|uniref:alpha/beta hydrolase n=1 Tax=Microbispora oryzae TaxID=2806554 RepID=UPI0027DC158B|nr:alpha/beta hydrolase [Microbispora oryzae]
MRRTALCRLAAAALLLVGGCSTGQGPGGGGSAPARITAPTAALQPFYDQRPSWTGCGGGFQCARVEVPLDYSAPSGERISLSVIRLPATGQRIGSLFINPGGPGGSGVQYTRAARSLFPDSLRARFDVVGFDPRGVGESSPVKCLSNSQLDAFVGLDASPDDHAEVKALEKGSKDFAAGCEAKSARLLPHVSTVDAARDMDVLRGVVRDPGFTYLGKSYGTFLGATYAGLFPKQVRALVLDGAVDPAVPSLRANEVQAEGFEVALRAFVEDSLKQQDNPFTSRTVDGALAEVGALLKRADGQPLRNDLKDGRRLGEAWTVLGVITPLYDRQSWPALRRALKAAFKGDGTTLLRMADLLVDRHADGSYSNQTEANMAVNCLDHPYPTALGDYRKAADKAAVESPHFGSYVMWSSLPCAYWPVKPTGADEPIKAEGAPPILVVGTLRDPATPYEWAKGLASELKSGVLLGFDGDGHTGYRSGSRCVDTAVENYLISLHVPKSGTVCPKIT